MNYKKNANKQNSVSENLIVSYDSEGNPYSYYSSDEWNLWSLKMVIRFTRLSGYFKEQTKEIVYKLILKNRRFLKLSATRLMNRRLAIITQRLLF